MGDKIKKSRKKFKSFTDTFQYCSFALALANIYPNKHNLRIRTWIFLIIVAFSGPELFWFFVYTYDCLAKLDMLNLARNITLCVVVYLFFFKTIYALIYTEDFAAILNIMTNDYLKGNDMDEEYQKIYETYLKKSKTIELVWVFVPTFLSAQFPIYAAILMIIDNFTLASPKKYMVHEMDMIYVEHIQYTAPFFEMFFAYNLFQCVVLCPIFTGFDGSFCIATNHLCMKMKLMTHKVRRAFMDAKNSEQLRAKVREAIQDHQEVFEFYDRLSNFFGLWLLMLFFVASIAVSFNLLQMYIMQQVVPKYAIFMVSAIFHIYIPCVSTSTVTQVAADTATDLYNVPWESCHDDEVTKYLIFMIARSQKAMIFSGKGMVNYNMQLFISLMQSAYSFYTLIAS